MAVWEFRRRLLHIRVEVEPDSAMPRVKLLAAAVLAVAVLGAVLAFLILAGAAGSGHGSGPAHPTPHTPAVSTPVAVGA